MSVEVAGVTGCDGVVVTGFFVSFAEVVTACDAEDAQRNLNARASDECSMLFSTTPCAHSSLHGGLISVIQ